MKAIDKILEALPLPLLAAVAALVLLAWAFKELAQRQYGDVLRDPYFQAAVVVVCAAVGVYYALTGIFSQEKPFTPNERGVLIAKFEGDSSNTARIHTIETLKTRIGEQSEFENVKIRALDKTVIPEDGKSVARDQNAIGIITGSFLPPPNAVLHYQMYWRGSERVARLTADKFPDIKNFEEQFLQQIRSVPTAANLQSSKLEDLQAQISALKHENERLLQLSLAPRGPTATFPGSTKPTMYVLAIGVSEYENNVLRLRYAADDAKQFATALSKSHGFLARNVTVIIDADATRSNILRALDDILKKATDDDYVYFYFAGHSANLGEQLYLLPVNAAVDRLRATGLSLRDLTAAVIEGRSKQALFFFDAALSAASGPNADFIASNLASNKSIGLMVAAAPGQATIEDQALGSGVFTYYLVRGVQGAASGANGAVTLSQLYSYVQQNVRQATRDASSPLVFRTAVGLDDLIVTIPSASQ
jgi:hypothetical protein